MNIHINLVLKAVEHYEKTFFANFAALADKPEAASVLLEDTVFVVFCGEVEASEMLRLFITTSSPLPVFTA
jgi:hypothetical protein